MSKKRSPETYETPHLLNAQSGHIVDVRPTTPRGEARGDFGINKSARAQDGKHK